MMPLRNSIVFLECDLFHLAGRRSSQTIRNKDRVGEVACCKICSVRPWVGAYCEIDVAWQVGVVCEESVAGVGAACGVGAAYGVGVGAACRVDVFLVLVYVASFVLVVYAESPRFHADVVLALKKKIEY